MQILLLKACSALPPKLPGVKQISEHASAAFAVLAAPEIWADLIEGNRQSGRPPRQLSKDPTSERHGSYLFGQPGCTRVTVSISLLANSLWFAWLELSQTPAAWAVSTRQNIWEAASLVILGTRAMEPSLRRAPNRRCPRQICRQL